MSQRMFPIRGNAANARDFFGSRANEGLVKERQPASLSQGACGARRNRPVMSGPQPGETGESLVPSLGSHLDRLLYTCWLPGRWVQRVWVLADLPLRLEERARSLPTGAIWRAYTDGMRLWFATAAAADSSSYGPSAVAMEVLFFENDGALCSGGIWACDPSGDWRLERLVDMSAETRFDWYVRRACVQSSHKVRHRR